MNIREFDNQARYQAMLRADGRCEICGGEDCGNEVLEDHHIISRGHWLTRWASWNHLVTGRKHHEKPHESREWVRVHRPKVWRRLRRAELRLARGGYRERNMNPERVRARIQRFGKVLQGAL